MRPLTRSLRRTPAQVGARMLTALAAVALLVLLTLSGATLPLDQALFDLAAASRRQEGDRQVVVVTIDQASVARLGPWPWPGRELAQLVDRLSDAGTRAIGLHLLLAQSSLYDPQGDARLAQALARDGAVVLPVVIDLASPTSPATAILPQAGLMGAAAGLGHTDAITDQDGVARRVALHAGLGDPRWPAFALALKQLALATAPPAPPVLPGPPAEAPQDWVRTDIVLLAYPGDPDDIVHVSAAAVLDGSVDPRVFAGRIAIVGRTDLGPDQRLSLPGAPNSLPRVDFQANALARLLEGRAIWPMPVGPQILLSIILVTLPLLLLGLPGLRRLWRPMGVAMALVLLVSWALLMAGAWFPPLPALLVLAVGLAAGTATAAQRARQRSLTDPATGMANRLCFEGRLDGETRRARRDGRPLSLLLVEARGTASQAPGSAGDLAAAMAAGLRLRAQAPRDLVARLDAFRFAALLPDTAPHVAAALATALMVDLEGRPGRPGPATAGQALRMGLASLQPEDTRGADLLLRATRDLVSSRDPVAHQR
jgi:CHASE2 domain-containing sensor protein